MEHISIKKKIDRVIVTHKIEKNEQINTMEMDIINRNEIPALLPIQLRKSIMGEKLRFILQDFVDMRTFLKSDISFETFARIVLQIVDAFQDCESHGIRSSNLEMNCDLVFFDYSRQQVRLLCWPLISLSSSVNPSAFFMELGSVYRSRSDDSDFRVKYLRFFDSRAKFQLDSFKQYVETLLAAWQKEQMIDPEAGGTSGSSGKLSDLPPTVGLRTASIQRVATQTMINVSRYPFSIGRVAEFCDYAIADNRFVSKKHITILLRNGQTYIRDNGSANGTFVNGIRVPANMEVELPSGTHFQIGNEDFIFYAAGG